MVGIRRVTAPTLEVLRTLLDASEPVWGLLIVKATGLAPGTVYPILGRLEDAGWIVGVWEDDSTRSGPRRRLYELTEAGATEAAGVVAAKRRVHQRAIPRTAPRAAGATS